MQAAQRLAGATGDQLCTHRAEQREVLALPLVATSVAGLAGRRRRDQHLVRGMGVAEGDALEVLRHHSGLGDHRIVVRQLGCQGGRLAQVWQSLAEPTARREGLGQHSGVAAGIRRVGDALLPG